MSICSTNYFVVEGEKGKEIYELLMNVIEKCVEFSDYDRSVQDWVVNRYELGEFMGKKYFINKYLEYGDVCYSVNTDNTGSSFYLEDIVFENDVLYMKETCCNSLGTIWNYVRDSKLYEYPGFYYYGWSEQCVSGVTTDKEGKYFEKTCVILDSTKEIDDITPKNFDKLSFEEQLSFCELHKDKIYYETTKIIDFN